MTDAAVHELVDRVGATAPGPAVQPPTRPTWSPVEEARKRAELAMAAVAANGARSAPKGPTSRASHHTLIPRLMVLVALFGSVVSVFANRLLVWRGEAAELLGATEYTPLGRLLWIVLVGGSTGLYLAGWVWWTAAAGANARHKTPKAGSAAFAPVAHGVFFALIAAIAFVVGRDGENDVSDGMLLLVLLGAWMVAYLGVLLLFARKAEAIKAPRGPWSRMLWLPFATWFTAGLFVRLGDTQDLPTLTIAGAVIGFALTLWYLASVANAMKSFDEACRTQSFGRSDGDVPEFMRMAIAGR